MFSPNNIRNLAKDILNEGGDIAPILIPNANSENWAQTNPSVIVVNNEILVNLRCVEYALIDSDKGQKFWSRWGPLTYAHSEKIMALRTFNVLCKMNPEALLVDKFAKIDTSELDSPPLWKFHGLEDCRLAYWEGHLYGIGVRRDTTNDGQGRMQYQEIDYSFENQPYAKETKRTRIEPPIDNNSYCEKNWMPILDMPHHFIKWTNSTEIVKANPDHTKSEQVKVSKKYVPLGVDLRGGSQVIKWKTGWLTITHEYIPTKNLNEHQWKDAFYFSRFIEWDSDWNIISTSQDFSFMDGRIEFVCGMDNLDENFVLVTFGFCDSSAYIAKIPKTLIEKMLIKKW
jgi:predicted GH43/DUF377 family glycosyl hydrolase